MLLDKLTKPKNCMKIYPQRTYVYVSLREMEIWWEILTYLRSTLF